MRQLLSPALGSWEEAERLLRTVTRAEGKRFLDGKLDDPARKALYRVLFHFQPGLKAALMPQPTGPVSVLRLTEPSPRGADGKLAAKHAPPPSETLLTSGSGHRLRAFPHRTNGRTTLHLKAPGPTKAWRLFVDGDPLKLDEPFDKDGYGVVKTRKIAPVLQGRATLEIVSAEQFVNGEEGRND